MEYEAVIGLEVHAQLLTSSKMFCSCAADYQAAPPNTRVCPVCLGMPGVLPVINKRAVEFTIMTGLALHCTISEFSKFDRKNYPYPDLMKGYQVSQYDLPFCKKGWLEVDVEGHTRRIGVTRVHLEEDVAKLLHRSDPSGDTYSLVDVNRAGVPLMEIVGEPDIRSPEEARLYLMKLRTILQYLGVSTGNMEEGSFRCDANISIRPQGSTELPKSKVEVKNMNSFKAVFKALQFEMQRQVQVIESGGRIVQETRGWSDEKGVTVSQRSKEQAHDYRYFPEPDLPPLVVGKEWIETIRARLPELPDARRDRFVASFGLPLQDATLLTSSKATADFFEACVAARVVQQPESSAKAKAVANWVLGDLSHLLNNAGIEFGDPSLKLTPKHLAELLDLLDNGSISGATGKDVLHETFKSGEAPGAIVKERGLVQISDSDSLGRVVDEVIEGNAQAVQDYLKGKETATRFLVGQVMKATKGRANPGVVNDLLKQKLAALSKR